jgi:GMP synthase (glutamine-hydrolysing)
VRPVAIVKCGSTEPSVRERRGDFEDWIQVGMGLAAAAAARVVSVAKPIPPTDPLPHPGTLAGVVVTGSSAMVSQREDWSERTAGWLIEVLEAGTPLLGICYGHQLLAHALGGRVAPSPRGREIGTITVKLGPAARADALLGALPEQLTVQATHVESVLELPPAARLLGASDADPHHVIAVGECAWGVQFHPEFDADVMRGYLLARADVLAAEGLDSQALLARVRPSPDGTALLRRFAGIVRERAR